MLDEGEGVKQRCSFYVANGHQIPKENFHRNSRGRLHVASLLMLMMLSGQATVAAARSTLGRPDACSWRTVTLDALDESELFCNIRTIDSLEHLMINISRSNARAGHPSSLHVECSDILFFESTLTAHDNITLDQKLMSHLKHLTIDKCKVRQVPPKSFFKFQNLKSLRLITHNSDWSAMTMEVNEDSFSGLNELTHLDLSDNNMWSTHKETFCPLYSLQHLNLTGNHLQNINSLGFSVVNSESDVIPKSCNMVLETLDLSKNDFIIIPDKSFFKLRSLHKLFLQDNAISAIEDRALSGVNGLLVLNLSGNYITSLPPDLFQGTRDLNEIYLSNNSLNVLPPGIFDGLEQLRILDLSSNDLTSHWVKRGTFSGLLRMVVLNLSSNRLSKIDSKLFRDMFTLQILNLENNEIENIAEHSFVDMKNLHALILSNNRIIEVKPYIFSDLFVLNQLFLDNNLIRIVETKSFDNMTSLEDLVLSSNKLTVVPDAVRNRLSLKSLDIGNNNISFLSRNSFEGLPELFGLRLVDNNISYLARDTFEHLPKLQVLNLASNKIKNIELGCFRSNMNIKALRLDGNEISSLSGIFDGLHSLAWLNMSDNNIGNFDYNHFPTTLEWLDLHKNYIKNLITGKSASQLNIKLLDLSYNNIIELSESSIPVNVEKLYLNHNHLKIVHPGAFSKLWRLSTVTLNENKIEKLDLNAFRIETFSDKLDLPEFYISGNPFTCDCSMEWLQRINHLSHTRQYPRVLDLDKTTCRLVHSRSSPNKPLIDMSPSEFLCPYDSHCFALCHCCDFDACDCKMICPSRCRCYHDITWTANVVDCSMAGYDHVPPRIPMDATQIYLDGNDIKKLGSHVFIGKKKLEVLFLNSSKLEEVDNQTFKGVESLKILHLENNRLVELKGDEFNQLNNLNELYLDHNTISHVGNNTFSAMKSLEVLKIDENKLVNFSPWQLLASATQNMAHVSFEGNKWSCDCINIVKLESWLRKKSGDPEKMFCSDTLGNPTTVTISSVISHCKEYMGDSKYPSILHNDIHHNSILMQNNYITFVASAVIVIIIICSFGAIIYAFRRDLGRWLMIKHRMPMFKQQSCINVQMLENCGQYYDLYVINSTEDVDSINQTVITELEFRGYSVTSDWSKEGSSNIVILQKFLKSPKCAKRLLIILTPNFILHDLSEIRFKTNFINHLKRCSFVDMSKIIFIIMLDSRYINKDNELLQLLETFKYIIWDETKFWDKFRILLSMNEPTTLLPRENNIHKNNTLARCHNLRYTAMPVVGETSCKNDFKLTHADGNVSMYREVDSNRNPCSPCSEGSSFGGGSNSNNSYMSLNSKGCAHFSSDLRRSPSCHVYSKVDELVHTNHLQPKALNITSTDPARGRTYFV